MSNNGTTKRHGDAGHRHQAASIVAENAYVKLVQMGATLLGVLLLGVLAWLGRDAIASRDDDINKTIQAVDDINSAVSEINTAIGVMIAHQGNMAEKVQENRETLRIQWGRIGVLEKGLARVSVDQLRFQRPK